MDTGVVDSVVRVTSSSMVGRYSRMATAHMTKLVAEDEAKLVVVELRRSVPSSRTMTGLSRPHGLGVEERVGDHVTAREPARRRDGRSASVYDTELGGRTAGVDSDG